MTYTESAHQGYSRNKVFTVPNLLTCIRLLLIPVFMWLYIRKQNYGAAALVLILSGITDFADGFIARKCHMVSMLGKALDPIADKLTQGAMLFCLVKKYPQMLLLLMLLIVKELAAGIMGLVILIRSGQVYSAEWHGKNVTFLLCFTIILHVVFPGLPSAVSIILLVLCAVSMIVSGTLYMMRNLRRLEKRREEGT